MSHFWFPIRRIGIFHPGKDIEGLRGAYAGTRRTGKHAMDAARAKKNHSRMETRYGQNGDEWKQRAYGKNVAYPVMQANIYFP